MTPNKEDYLKCIYELGQGSARITNKMIAEKMLVSAPAVSEMLKKILADALIIKDNQSGYLLTEAGLKSVSKLYRKHRLLEVFLIEKLKYKPEAVHTEAEILEHTVSDHFINQLEVLLGFPKQCPHGGIIPAAHEILKEPKFDTLSQIDTPGHFQLMRIIDDIQLLKYLKELDFLIGDQFELTQLDDYAGSYTLRLEKNQATIQMTKVIAQQLYIQKR